VLYVINIICKMDIDLATNAVKEEHLQMEESDTDGSCTTKCVNGNWSAEIKLENLTVVKQEPVVCFYVIFISSQPDLW